jgi:hypothetical protein
VGAKEEQKVFKMEVQGAGGDEVKSYVKYSEQDRGFKVLEDLTIWIALRSKSIL